MKPTCLLFVVFAVLCSLNASSAADSLVYLSDLGLSESERTAFRSAPHSGESQMLNLFLCQPGNAKPFSSEKAQELLNACVNDLKQKTKGQDEVKAVKTIYKEVHRRFLTTYVLENSFSDLLEKGEYNCVSGSALYALIFEKMNIPYQIVEAPQHVFLFAWPSTHRVAIETTDPKSGYLRLNDSYIQKYVRYLYEQKLIPKDEYENSSAAQLFDTYYFEKNGLSLRGLAAVQLTNYAIYALNNNATDRALPQIKRAYYLLPNERNRYILVSTLWNSLADHAYKTPEDIANLTILCRAHRKGAEESGSGKIRYEFARLTEERLISNSDFEGYIHAFQAISPALSDTTLRNEIAFGFHYELARLSPGNSKSPEFEEEHLKAAYALKPRHADLRHLIKSSFFRRSENLQEAEELIVCMDRYSSHYGFLAEDEQFTSIRANGLLELAWRNFMIGQAGKGEQCLKQFEKLCSDNRQVKAGSQYIEKAYATAAGYYYKKGNTAKTRSMLQTGLRYAPGNYGLQARLQQAR